MNKNFEVIKSIVPNQDKKHELETIELIVAKLEENNITLFTANEFTEENKKAIAETMELLDDAFGLFKYSYGNDWISLLKKNYENKIEFIYNDMLLADNSEKYIEVYNDNEKVFEGTIQEFLKINEADEDYLMNMLNNENNVIEFNEVSGNWKIIKAS